MTLVASDRSLAEDIVDAVRSVVGEGAVPLHEPCFAGNEWATVKDCLDSTFVSSVGEYVDRFEEALQQFTGAGHAVAVVNGTAALHIALKLAGVRAGDEVLVPSLTFVATANAVSYCGATPHFVDSEEQSLGICPARLRRHLESIAVVDGQGCTNRTTGRPIRVLLPMHVFGHPSDIRSLAGIAEEFKLVLVEDAAESLGSYYQERHTGTFGLLGTLSFNGNKTITTGGGGAILTDDSELARMAKHLTTTAKLAHPWKYEHDQVGYNYRMPNLNAALGCAQMEALPGLLESKRKLHESYRSAFKTIHGVTLLSEPPGTKSNYWLQTVVFGQGLDHAAEETLELANRSGLQMRPVWTPMHLLKPYRQVPSADLENAESFARLVVNLPSSAQLAA